MNLGENIAPYYEPNKEFVVLKEGGFIIKIKKFKAIWLSEDQYGNHSVFIFFKPKKKNTLLEIPCDSKERGLEMIANISKLLPNVETV
jgi:hypothetical protein